MSDYHATVQGTYGNGVNWSFGTNITSQQNGQGLLTTWANAWGTAWSTASTGLATLYPTTTKITNYRIALLDGNYSQTSAWSQTADAPGTAVGDSLPFQEAVCISLRGTQIGRHARGRFYLPALEETFVNDNVIISNAMSRLSSAVKAVQAQVTADGSTFFVYARPKKNPATPAGPKYVMTQFLVSNKPARQSRRVRKVLPTYL
jgi:hypothetical protein